MRSFAQRSCEVELMDAPDVPPEVFADCLADLARANTLTRARPPTLRWLARATGSLTPGQGFSLLDVGYGQGDMLRAVYAWALKAGLRPRLAGVDLSPWSAPAARAATDLSLPIEYRIGDVFDYASDEPTDYVISSLVAHHMPDDQLIRFIRWMDQTSRRGWFVNDLHRHPVAFYGFKALSAAAGLHRFVRHDGPISVARAFRREDWRRLLTAAGLSLNAVTIDWRFPFRICVGRIK
jgi:2-polyprenyl-3-methyl-5-hydroxy-6-metoxy-1,4-benzoquinol methylase